MRSRFLGASPYDEEDEEDEGAPEEMDMSGFMTSSETQPPMTTPLVVERSRISRTETSAPTPVQGNAGMGNAGPRMVYPPKSSIGYAPKMVTDAGGDGSPWNPLWAHDATLGPNMAPIVLKCAGLAGVFAGGVYSAGTRSILGVGGKMVLAGSAAYLHPALGLGHGAIANYYAKTTWTNMGWTYATALITHGVGGYVFYRVLTRGSNR